MLRCIFKIGFLLFLLSTLVTGINFFYYQFPGNNYFPRETFEIGFFILAALIGCYLQFGKESNPFAISKELALFFIVMCLIAFATNAVQYTPFLPIDERIIQLEKALSINEASILSWTIKHSFLTQALVWIYDSLPSQMALLPLFVIFSKKFDYIHEYFCLMLICTLIGFSFYYFFPTLGPASFLQGPFSLNQHATGLKFKEIHNHIAPTTIEGGMVAMPSFHVIWACLNTYLIRWSSMLTFFVLPYNLCLIASCVLLGWHYPLDLVGSGFLLLLTAFFYKNLRTHPVGETSIFNRSF